MKTGPGQQQKPYLLRIEDRPDYLYAYVESERRDYDVSVQYWKEIAEASNLSDHINLIVEKGTSPPTSLTDAFELVSEFPKMGFTSVRLAFVDPSIANQPINEFAETVATNRGIVGRVFNNLADAEKWILDE